MVAALRPGAPPPDKPTMAPRPLFEYCNPYAANSGLFWSVWPDELPMRDRFAEKGKVSIEATSVWEPRRPARFGYGTAVAAAQA